MESGSDSRLRDLHCAHGEALAGTGTGLRLREPLRAAGAGHLYYMLIGAAATPYAFADEFELLTGMEPSDNRLVDQHVDAVIELFFEEQSEGERS